MVSTSARHEAIALIESVLNELQSPSRDLVALLRKCQTACTLLGRQEAEWIRRELDGYPPDTELPAHRRVAATLSWTISGPLYEIQRWMTGCLVYGRPLEDEDQVTTYEVRPGAIHFPSWTTTGYSFRTGEHKRSWDLSAKREVELFQTCAVAGIEFSAILTNIESITYNFVVTTYKVLRYSDALTGILSKYRSSVEDALQRLNLSEHLAAIQAGIQSPNPAEWRSAVFSCRNLLSDLAGLLWQDSRSTYIHIRNDKGQEISVTPNAFSNRLGAYLHQKGIHGKSIGYLRTESERLAASIRSLVEFQGKAHDPMTLEEAETVASGTFFLIGEIALKTDLEPISQYGEPNEAT